MTGFNLACITDVIFSRFLASEDKHEAGVERLPLSRVSVAPRLASHF